MMLKQTENLETNHTSSLFQFQHKVLLAVFVVVVLFSIRIFGNWMLILGWKTSKLAPFSINMYLHIWLLNEAVHEEPFMMKLHFTYLHFSIYSLIYSLSQSNQLKFFLLSLCVSGICLFGFIFSTNISALYACLLFITHWTFRFHNKNKCDILSSHYETLCKFNFILKFRSCKIQVIALMNCKIHFCINTQYTCYLTKQLVLITYNNSHDVRNYFT